MNRVMIIIECLHPPAHVTCEYVCVCAEVQFMCAEQQKHECPSSSEDGTRATGGRI